MKSWFLRYALSVVAIGGNPIRPAAVEAYQAGAAALLRRGLARRHGRALRLTPEGRQAYRNVLASWGVSPC